MGCAYPIKVKNKNFDPGGVKPWQRKKYYYVPCGKCLECMKAKRTFLKDVCDYEYNKYGCGSFTTLTYDDENVPIDYDTERAILNYKDIQDFNKRLRINLSRKYGFNVKYSFIAVGEYGSENERSHYHILFFGLDWANHDKIITESWNKGIVTNMPIKRGGVSYVLKYMDKDRIRNNKHYNENKDLRPFLKHSVGIAKDFIEAHYEEIIKYHGMYTLDHGQTLKPIPIYYMNKLNINKPLDTEKTREEMVQYKFKGITNPLEYTLNDVMTYRMYKAKDKMKQTIDISRRNGEPQEDFDEFYFESMIREIL